MRRRGARGPGRAGLATAPVRRRRLVALAERRSERRGLRPPEPTALGPSARRVRARGEVGSATVAACAAAARRIRRGRGCGATTAGSGATCDGSAAARPERARAAAAGKSGAAGGAAAVATTGVRDGHRERAAARGPRRLRERRPRRPSGPCPSRPLGVAGLAGCGGDFRRPRPAAAVDGLAASGLTSPCGRRGGIGRAGRRGLAPGRPAPARRRESLCEPRSVPS